MSDATARPWVRSNNSRYVSCKGDIIADCGSSLALSDDEMNTHTATIVRDHNAHDALLAACELASAQEECVCKGKGECLGCVLRAAIKAARG